MLLAPRVTLQTCHQRPPSHRPITATLPLFLPSGFCGHESPRNALPWLLVNLGLKGRTDHALPTLSPAHGRLGCDHAAAVIP